jgi:hypothetical protein
MSKVYPQTPFSCGRPSLTPPPGLEGPHTWSFSPKTCTWVWSHTFLHKLPGAEQEAFLSRHLTGAQRRL